GTCESGSRARCIGCCPDAGRSSSKRPQGARRKWADELTSGLPGRAAKDVVRSSSRTVGRMPRVLIAAFVLLVVGACGPFGSIGTPAATASSVALQSSDLASGMQRCDLSGNITDYLKKIQTKDPATYITIKEQWAGAQKDGATDADVEFYTDTAAHCTALASNGSQIGTAT